MGGAAIGGAPNAGAAGIAGGAPIVGAPNVGAAAACTGAFAISRAHGDFIGLSSGTPAEKPAPPPPPAIGGGAP